MNENRNKRKGEEEGLAKGQAGVVRGPHLLVLDFFKICIVSSGTSSII